MHGVEVLATRATFERTEDDFAWVEVAPMSVKGKAIPIVTYVPRRLTSQETSPSAAPRRA